jgi:hypothetical protein
MISRWFLLTVFAVVFAPGLVYAQPTDPSSQSSPPRRDLTISDKGTINVDKMYEDIEILRRILDRKLTSLYPSVPSKGERANPFGSATLSGSPDGASNGTILYTPETEYEIDRKKITSDNQNFLRFEYVNPYPASIPFRSLEGIYLLGHGVIYTATLSSLQPPAKAEADSTIRGLRLAIVQHDSEWDSIRRQVRNEKAEPKKPESSKPPSLSDVLLKMLAENGHHFSQLSENERLTIVLTVHETSSSSTAAKSGTGSAKKESKPGNWGGGDFRAQLRDLDLLGELHLKQGKYDEAIPLFHKRLEITESQTQRVELRRKLAQC